MTHLTGSQEGSQTPNLALKQKLVLGVPAYGRNRRNAGDVKTYGEIVRDHQVKPDQDELESGMYWNGPRTVCTSVWYGVNVVLVRCRRKRAGRISKA